MTETQTHLCEALLLQIHSWGDLKKRKPEDDTLNPKKIFDDVGHYTTVKGFSFSKFRADIFERKKLMIYGLNKSFANKSSPLLTSLWAVPASLNWILYHFKWDAVLLCAFSPSKCSWNMEKGTPRDRWNPSVGAPCRQAPIDTSHLKNNLRGFDDLWEDARGPEESRGYRCLLASTLRWRALRSSQPWFETRKKIRDPGNSVETPENSRKS